jgi:hypothetical protein
MSATKHLRSCTAILALSLVAVSPALAQGKGKAKGQARADRESAQVQRERPTLQRRGSETVLRPRAGDRDEAVLRPRAGDRNEDRGDYERRDDARWEDILYGDDERRRRDVPPGWCQGRGNPHNTPENCGYSSDRRYDYDRDDRYGGYGSYSEAHTAFHRVLDREYAARSAQRRSDPVYQIRLRADKAADHDRWHERMGTRH